MADKLDTSKVPASRVESLSTFLRKKPAQTEVPDSPYKNLIKTDTKIILNDSTSDAADFKSPIPNRKPQNLISKPKKAPVKKCMPTKRGSKKSTSKNSTLKTITDNFKYFGENPEHMQMAIALSKSSYEAVCGSSGQSPSKEEIPYISKTLQNTKPAFLERFGFTSCRKILPVENRKAITGSSEITKKSKNRFKYITPILNIRTVEERNSLIDSKISLILSQNNPQPKNPYEHAINSNTLNDCISKERSIFNLDNIYQFNDYYVKCLEIPHHIYKCGYLLKDWNLIPGRDKSPCKIVKSESTKEEPANCKEQEADLSPIRTYTKTIDDAKETTFFSQTIGKEKSPYEKSPVKHLSETLSLGASCSLSVSTEIQKSTLGSINLGSKDSVTPNLSTSLTKPTVQSFSSSSCRSISPDLFGSDDETDHKFLNKTTNNVPKSPCSPKDCAETVKECSLDNGNVNQENVYDSVGVKLGYYLTSNQETIKNYNSLGKSCVETALPIEIIDLTDDDDDDENTNKFSNTSLSSPIEIIMEADDYCVDSHLKNCPKNSPHTQKSNIYNLDEFENDNCDEIQPSPEHKEHFKNLESEYTDQYNEDLNNETGNGCDFVASKDNYETLITTSMKNQNESVRINNISPSRIQIVNDCYSKTIHKSNSFSYSFNKSDVKDSSRTSTGSKIEKCVNTYIIDDYPPDSHHLDVFNREEIKAEQDSSPNDTPKRNRGYKRLSSFYDQVSSDNYCENYTNNKKNDVTSNKNSSRGETEKICVKSKNVRSPCFDEPIFYNSSDLNVTDYVNNMLSQENLSFDKIKCGGESKEGRYVSNDEELLLSQGSQNSIIFDEELNYSSHFATPNKNNEARNKRKCSYENEREKLESSEMQQPICLETPPTKNVSINPELVPQITISKQDSTPDNFIVKTNNVTPMPEYDKMTTPLINTELQKVGVKPLKRTRGAKLLKYIYESTHPFVGPKENIVPDNSESDEDKRIIKRRRNINDGLNNSECNSLSICVSSIEIMGDRIIENERLEDLIFERKQLTKIAACKVPLQIVWHNLVSSHKAIKENILLYEPLQLESLHIMLKEQGFKFHIQDLLTFLDKKCITIRTAQKQGKLHR